MEAAPKSSQGKSPPGSPPSGKSPEDRLDSWKEIAVYLNRDVTTVQRWEKREGMPVHRHLHDRIGSVYGSRTELDAWQRGRHSQAVQESEEDVRLPDPPAAPPRPQKSTSGQKWLLVLMLVAVLGIGAAFWLQKTEFFWRSPIAHARFQPVTDFGGMEQAAAVSRDGHFIAFLSDRDGQMDIWLTQAGSGEFHNLTRGSAKNLVNASVRVLAFSPDGSLVTYWNRREDNSNQGKISVWAVPTLGGQPRPYMEGVAEYDWSRDGSRLAYHTPGPGDPLYVSNGSLVPEGRPIFTAPAGSHSHFPLWSADAAFLYFVRGVPPDKLDLWRIPSAGGVPERMTWHHGYVTYPVLFDKRTLMYLAGDAEGGGPWLYSMDVERRVPHQLTSGVDRYTSLAASADGRRLVATLSSPKKTLWRLLIDEPAGNMPAVTPISLTTGPGFFPRLGPDYLVYVSENGAGEGLWKIANGATTELWAAHQARLLGGPAISPDGRSIAFSVRQQGQTLLYVMQADGASAHIVSGSLDLQGGPAWTPDGKAITSAVLDHGVPQIFRIPIDGRTPDSLVPEYSIDPAWTADGRIIAFSGPEIGTRFVVKAVSAEAAAHPLPSLTLTRGARHVAFLPGGHSLMVLRGEIEHKDLWVDDLDTGVERQLTSLPADFDVRDFDISPDGREVVLERVQERSDVVLLDLPHP